MAACPSLISDNQLYLLPWHLSDPPKPTNPESQYMYVSCLGSGNCFFHSFLRAVDSLYIESYEIPDTITEDKLEMFERFMEGPLNIPSHAIRPSPRSKGATYQILDKYAFEWAMLEFRRKYACVFRRYLADFLRRDKLSREIALKYFGESISEKVAYMFETTSETVDLDQLTERAVTDFLNELADRIGEVGRPIEPELIVFLSEIYDLDIYILSRYNLEKPGAVQPLIAAFYHVAVRGPQDMRLTNGDEPNRNAIVILFSGVTEGHYDAVARADPTETGWVLHFQMDQEEPLIRRLFGYLIQLKFGS